MSFACGVLQTVTMTMPRCLHESMYYKMLVLKESKDTLSQRSGAMTTEKDAQKNGGEPDDNAKKHSATRHLCCAWLCSVLSGCCRRGAHPVMMEERERQCQDGGDRSNLPVPCPCA